MDKIQALEKENTSKNHQAFNRWCKRFKVKIKLKFSPTETEELNPILDKISFINQPLN